MEFGNLPQEILIEIFSRLPLKSVGKCRCLAKLWRQQLSTPHFIKSHLTHQNHHSHQENLILNTPFDTIYSRSSIKGDTIWKKLPAGGLCEWTDIVGSCDGLVFMVLEELEEFEKFLVNPITLQLVKVPESPLALKRKESFSMDGFGYDSCSDDYKVVTLSYYDTDNHNSDRVETFVDVFSVKRGVWRRVDSSPYEHDVPQRSPYAVCKKALSPGAFVNGALHWLARSRKLGSPSVIAAFNLANEMFDEIPAPNGVDVQSFVFNKLVVLGGCLCMIDGGVYGPMDVWTMKVYGLEQSWTKFRIQVDYDWDIYKPLCFISDEEVVLITHGRLWLCIIGPTER
ncbi:F-box/kelch-repeat protein [Sesamum angolense]|uniref:F-box/kelch-repeat protein n=1 Tax=Sesamum angolense TaxID=2727404 RepID=A0AAE1WLY7_9LAMI|nr:F-box/kelch-repeat protein [Sesamum angolense]